MHIDSRLVQYCWNSTVIKSTLCGARLNGSLVSKDLPDNPQQTQKRWLGQSGWQVGLRSWTHTQEDVDKKVRLRSNSTKQVRQTITALSFLLLLSANQTSAVWEHICFQRDGKGSSCQSFASLQNTNSNRNQKQSERDS